MATYVSCPKSERPLDCPAVAQSCVQRVVVNPGAHGPFRQRKRLAVPADHSIRSRVAHLLDLRCPAAIARLIASGPVDPIDAGLALGSAAHVSQEDGEVAPLLTDGDAGPAIEGPFSKVWVAAARAHCFPRPVFDRIPLRFAMNSPLRCPHLSLEAAAALRARLSQEAAAYRHGGAAFTPAKPLRGECTSDRSIIWSALDYRKATDSKPEHVYHSGHSHLSASLVRSAARFARDARRGWPPGARQRDYSVEGAA